MIAFQGNERALKAIVAMGTRVMASKEILQDVPLFLDKRRTPNEACKISLDNKMLESLQ